MPENNSLDEQGQHGPTSLHISEGNTQDDRQRRPFPLGVPLTGNILFTIIWIVGLGIPKAVYSYRGQSLISPTLDWVAGIIFTLISFWLGVIESKRPELCPQFFEVDLAPCVLKFLRRDDVLVWLTSVLPLLLVVESKSSSVVYPDRERSFKWVWDEMLGFGRNFTTVRVEKVGPTWVVITTTFEDSYNLGDPNKPHSRSTKITQLYENGYILHALGAFMAVFLFCIHGSRVLWPRPFQGNVQYAFFMFAVMWWANLVFLSVKGLITNDLKFARIIIPMTIRLHVWMIPWAAPPILERRHFEEFFSRYSGSQKQAMQYLNVIWSVFTVILEVTVMFAWQKPKFPETLYGSFFLCCALVPIWKECSAIMPPSRIAVAPVAYFTSAWGAAYEGGRSAGTKAKAYVLGVYHQS